MTKLDFQENRNQWEHEMTPKDYLEWESSFTDENRTFFLETDSSKILELGLVPGRVGWKK